MLGEASFWPPPLDLVKLGEPATDAFGIVLDCKDTRELPEGREESADLDEASFRSRGIA